MQHVDSDNYSSDYETIFQDDFTTIDSSSDNEEIMNSNSDEENKLLYLTKIGYSEVEASIAMERCGPDSSIVELTDFICAAQMAKAVTHFFRKKHRKLEKKLLNEDAHAVHLPNLMIGFRVPTEPDPITQRTLSEDAIVPPYFYYENVELAPVERICKALEAYDDEPPSNVQKYVLDECRKWNLVWVGRNKVVPLEPDEVKMLLEVAFYCLGIPLKANTQELTGNRVEQLMSRFDIFDLVVSGRGLVHSHNTLNGTYSSVMQSSREHGLIAGENNLSGDAYHPQHEISDNLS
ncbi:DNA (Cytosine-5)-methyltransferase DRM1/2 isoform 2 [Hibiscus syriacus]|uniref:DNA (Cytosine-5)-methyltransferase DRM1/2 isoform 2 n=1 Tax=Hibiscus syriacus TaxID=106335 RepID=A0A6A2YPP8_HIBSY|nr:DNA (Cytosine-5)-methyltransferase DRM1/2 isoform 2 [Hibiscus syriacus]